MARHMAQISRLVLMALTALMIVSSSVCADSAWTEDYSRAKERAMETDRDLLIYFSGSDWCSSCEKLEQEVLSQAEFLEMAAKAYVLVQIDFPKSKQLDAATIAQNDQLQQAFKDTYRLEGFPTLYMATADGVPYAKTGYQEGGLAAFSEHLAFLKMAKPMEDPGSQWIEDISIAKAKAAYFGKDILMDFTGSDWCGYCIKLENQVFSQAAFKEKASQSFVFVKLDFPRRKKQLAHIVAQNNRLSAEFSAKYGLQGYPTLYLATAEGTPYGRAGYVPVTAKEYADGLVEMRKNDLKSRQQATTQEEEDS